MEVLNEKKKSALLAAVGPEGCDEVMKLVRPVPLPAPAGGGNRGGVEWRNLSCVVTEAGELLCIEHTLEGITALGPQSLGFVVPGRSRCRALARGEVSRDGVFGRLQVYVACTCAPCIVLACESAAGWDREGGWGARAPGRACVYRLGCLYIRRFAC